MPFEPVTNFDDLIESVESMRQRLQSRVAVTVNMQDKTWGYALRYAAGHLFLPVLIILSRLFRREIRW